MVKRLNIKNAEAHAMAPELAKQAGTTITQVVIDALQARKEELLGNKAAVGSNAPPSLLK